MEMDRPFQSDINNQGHNHYRVHPLSSHARLTVSDFVDSESVYGKNDKILFIQRFVFDLIDS
jgi:hypothetical protein